MNKQLSKTEIEIAQSAIDTLRQKIDFIEENYSHAKTRDDIEILRRNLSNLAYTCNSEINRLKTFTENK